MNLAEGKTRGATSKSPNVGVGNSPILSFGKPNENGYGDYQAI